MLTKIKYEAERCECCTQTKDYLLPIDRGTVDIMKAISVAIGKKGVNCIHPRKEMEVSDNSLSYHVMVREGMLTSNHVGNLSRARFHGLIARVDGQKGNYLLTTKGSNFLHGAEISRYAIISKVTGHNAGYYEPEQYTCKIKDFSPDLEYWEGINYTIKDYAIIPDVEGIKTNQQNLFDNPNNCGFCGLPLSGSKNESCMCD